MSDWDQVEEQDDASACFFWSCNRTGAIKRKHRPHPQGHPPPAPPPAHPGWNCPI
jgi:hypothetical protein